MTPTDGIRPGTSPRMATRSTDDPTITWLRRGFIAVGVISLALGLAGAWWRSESDGHGVRLAGVVDSVVQLRRARRGGAIGDVPIISTTLPDGTPRTFRNMFTIRPDVLQPGDTVTVVYRAEFPSIIYLEGSATSPFFALAVGGGLGVLFLFLGLWAIPALLRLGR